MSVLAAVFATIINFFAALLFGMLGVGAAPVFIPTIEGLGYGIATTVFPLAVLLNGINSGFALIPFARARNVDWNRGTVLSVIAAVFAFTGAYFAADIPARTLLYFLAAVLILLSAWTFARVKREGNSGNPSGRKVTLIAFPASIFAGFVGGLLAIGGGGLLVPFLMISGYNTKNAAGTTALVATVASAGGFLGFLTHGFIPLNLLLYSTIAIAIASILGAWFSIRLAKPSWLRLLLGLILLASALKIAVTLI
ncbi:MAG: sulfite exporter TauE/SafE family protein [Conexivisphaerales archaeon]